MDAKVSGIAGRVAAFWHARMELEGMRVAVSFDGHPIWDRLSGSEKADMESERRMWGRGFPFMSGPYVWVSLAREKGAEPKLVGSKRARSDGMRRQWRDEVTGAMFLDFMEG
jgi:hypothetical protein